MPHLFVGTASWTDPSLIKTGRFYPKGCTTAEARLRFYASQFRMVEVDSSYYAMPSARNSELWADRTPESHASRDAIPLRGSRHARVRAARSTLHTRLVVLLRLRRTAGSLRSTSRALRTPAPLPRTVGSALAVAAVAARAPARTRGKKRAILYFPYPRELG